MQSCRIQVLSLCLVVLKRVLSKRYFGGNNLQAYFPAHTFMAMFDVEYLQQTLRGCDLMAKATSFYVKRRGLKMLINFTSPILSSRLSDEL
jgi:hypothetical protein